MLYGKTSSDEKSSDQAVDDYFFDTPVRQWSVRDFLKNHSDSTPFIAGLDKIRRRRSVDTAIRTYATSWFKFMEGDLGKLRLEAFAAETKTSVTSGIIVEEERHLAQQRLRGHLREATAKALVHDTKEVEYESPVHSRILFGYISAVCPYLEIDCEDYDLKWISCLDHMFRPWMPSLWKHKKLDEAKQEVARVEAEAEAEARAEWEIESMMEDEDSEPEQDELEAEEPYSAQAE
ncbi:hypothetical protein BGX29_001682 [Mortierella sp. GBA35]|nr:hypothetical protein BGX29_001682 [Mortierella sp. GBA35]